MTVKERKNEGTKEVDKNPQNCLKFLCADFCYHIFYELNSVPETEVRPIIEVCKTWCGRNYELAELIRSKVVLE